MTPSDSGRDVISHARERSIISGSTSRHISSALTNKESYTSEPFPPRDDEYGIPVLNIDTDLETVSREIVIYKISRFTFIPKILTPIMISTNLHPYCKCSFVYFVESSSIDWIIVLI